MSILLCSKPFCVLENTKSASELKYECGDQEVKNMIIY